MTYITDNNDNYVTLLPGDELFTFQSGIMLVPRASIMVDSSCPSRYNDMLVQAIQRGWIKPVAHVQGKEATWQRLK